MKRVTVRDVAKAASVSPMSVSNFLYGRNNTMRAETRERIENAIRTLGYRPNAEARNLRLARRLSIGILIVDPAPYYLADPFTTHVVAGLSNRLSAEGYGLQIQGMAAHNFNLAPLISDIRTDGLCIIGSGPDEVRRRIVKDLLKLGQPLLLFQETFSFPGDDICVLHQDDKAGGRLVASEVLKRPLQNIVVLVPETTWPAIAERMKGMKEAVASSDSGAKLRVVTCGDADMADTQRGLAEDIGRNGFPDAILAGNDQMGIAALKLVTSLGKNVPTDVAITGFNGFDFWEYTDPVLTTVKSPAYEIGGRGGEEILHRLATGRFKQRKIVFPVTLQRGGST